jgi:ParB family chromosome partitioning protein
VRAIQPAGIAVTSISEGERALAKAKGSRPDLVVISAELRDMSGFSLCNRFRRTAGLSDVRILLVPGESDGPATEAHRASRSPADDYLSPGSGPEELLEHVRGLLGLNGAGLEAQDLGVGPIPLEQVVHSVPPPLPPQAPIPLNLSQAVAQPPTSPGPPALPRTTTRPTLRIDPFAELAAEPRVPLGASLEEKLNFFRDRVKAKDELLARVKQGWAELRDDLDARDRETAGLRNAMEEATRARLAAEAAQAAANEELGRLTAELEATATAMARLSQDSDGARQQAEERSQSLSEVLNDTLREREQAERDWASRLAEAEQRTSLLQEEIDHLAGTQEQTEARASKAEQAVVQQEAARAALQETQERTLDELRKELAAEREQRNVEQARMASLDADFEQQREEAEIWAGRRRELETDLATAQARRDELEQQLMQSSAREAELKGEVEALQQGDAEMHAQVIELSGKLGPAEAKLAELEAELESRSEEVAGLRSAGKQAKAEKETLEKELRERVRGLEQQLEDHSRKLGQKQSELQAAGGLSDRLADLRAQLDRKEVELTTSVQQIQDSFGSQVIDLRGQLEARERELGQTSEKLRTALGQVEALHAEFAVKDREHAVLKRRFQDVEQSARVGGEGGRGGGSAEQALRVRAADLAAELKVLRERMATQAGASEEVQKLRSELEDQRAENEFLTQELSRNAEKIQELQDELAAAEPLELETITDE